MLGRIFQRSEIPIESGEKKQFPSSGRVIRHSSGWTKTSVRLRAQEGLYVLDIGPTSHSNINYLTSLGHSIFMADIVEEANHSEWYRPPTDGLPGTYRVDAFIEKHMHFGQRKFDAVLLWDALDYIPTAFVAAVVHRLHDCMVEDGVLLSFFHAQASGYKSALYRYHLTDSENVEMQEFSAKPRLSVSPNRAIEKIFSEFRSCKFFLAKDNLSEVIVTR